MRGLVGPSAASVSSSLIPGLLGLGATTGAAGAAVRVDWVERTFGENSSVTSSMTAMGALSPLRGPILVILV